jgi:hypothetical protein
MATIAVRDRARAFPGRHLLQTQLAATAPDAAVGPAWGHLAVVGGWTLLGLLILRLRSLW